MANIVSPLPRRRPEAGGYARGDEKRTAILETAIRCFGDDGYAGASTRGIAAEAGVNPPAIQYYFGGKAGLYAACRHHVFDSLMDALGENQGTTAQAYDSRSAMRVFLCLLDALSDFLLDTAERRGWRRFLARMRANPNEVAHPEDGLLRGDPDFFGHVCQLVGVIISSPPQSDTVKLKTAAAMGLLTTFHLERDLMLARFGWDDLTGANLEALKTVIRQSATAILEHSE